MEWTEECVWMDLEDKLDTEWIEDEVDGVGDGGVLVLMKVQFLNMERMVGSSYSSIMLLVVLG